MKWRDQSPTRDRYSTKRLRKVEAALRRIEEGGYGRCERCGRPISDERLAAMPYTPYCVDDARQVEREREGPEPHLPHGEQPTRGIQSAE